MINIFVPKIKKILEFQNVGSEITQTNCSSFNPYILTKTSNWVNVYYDNNFFFVRGNDLYFKRNVNVDVNFHLRIASKNTTNNTAFVGITQFELGYTSITGNYKFVTLPIANMFYNYYATMKESFRENETLTIFLNNLDDLLIQQNVLNLFQLTTTI